MEIRIETEWTIGQLIEFEREQILRVNHEYQRGLRWTEMQKRMFIDSIFRGYSIPAFYVHKRQTATTPFQNTHFDIVDGQQRINAIYTYSEGAFSLLDPSEDSSFRFPNFVKDFPCPWGGKRFGELSDELQAQLKSHKIVVYEITTANENSIRDLFIRLQGGTPLTPQDKRDSWPGNFTEFVLRVGGKSGVDKWFGLPLFKEIAKVTNESRRRQLVAQIFMLFWTVRNEMKFCDIKSVNIDSFYHAHVDFDEACNEARRFEKICGVLYHALHGKPRLVGHYLIHLFLLSDSLLEEYAPGWEHHLADKLFEFERRRRETAEDIRDRREPEDRRYYAEYGHLTQTRSDSANTIRQRHAFFSEEMLKLLSPTKLDSIRPFSDFQRKTVFFRDMELCQWCRMEGNSHRVTWEECEIHHAIPHSHGGSTDLQNAVLVHRDCHPKSQVDIDEFREWRDGSPAHEAEPGPEYGTTLAGHRFPPPDGTKAEFKYGGRVYSGEIRGGKLFVGDGAHKSFSAASHAVTGTSRNGWRDWYLQLPGDEIWNLADDWRKAGTASALR